MQIGHGSFAQLGCGGQLEECGGVGALGRNGEQCGPAGDPGRDGGRSQVGWNGVRAMAGEEAQELHCFGAEPAAGLDADNDYNRQRRARPNSGRVRLAPLAPRCGNDSAARLDVGALGADGQVVPQQWLCATTAPGVAPDDRRRLDFFFTAHCL